MKVESWPIGKVKPYPNNPRIHNGAVDAVAASIQLFGFKQPLVVNAKGILIVGHVRLQAAHKLKLKTVPVIVARFSDEKARAYRIADNKSNELSDWDPELLTSELELLEDFKWTELGFSEKELDELLGRDEVDDEKADAVPETPAKAITQLGDVWTMGDHQLLCGDATDKSVWDQLKLSERSICFTSPPYNLGPSAKLRGKAETHKRGTVYLGNDDNMSDEDYHKLIDAMLANALARCDGVVFNVQPLAGSKRTLIQWLAKRTDNLCDIVTWDKQHAAPAGMCIGVVSSVYEWLVIFSPKPSATRTIPFASWRGTIGSVYRGPGQQSNEYASVHGATFPVHLPTFIMSELMNDCDGVVDCCLGSGTTLIAAERLGRRCCGIEVEPRYCDVSVKRWEEYTGKKATRRPAQAT